MTRASPHDRIDEKVDVWKAATLALRALTPGQGAFQRRPEDVAMLVGQAPAAVVHLLERALGDDRDARPSMAELAAAFLGHVARLSNPPVALRLEVVDRVLRRGTPLTIVWEFDGAEALAVETTDGVRHDLDSVQHAQGVTLVAESSGLLAVHATNRHGTSTFPVGPVHVYEVPTVPVVFRGPPPPDLWNVPAPRRPRPADLPALPSLGSGGPARSHGATPAVSAVVGPLQSDAERRLADMRRRASAISARLARLLRG